jgi:hypothetical protein
MKIVRRSKFGESSRYATAATLAVLVMPACSGSTHRSAAPIFGARFSTKVVGLCNKVLSEKKAEPPFPFAAFNPTKPDLSKLPAIGRYESRGVQIFHNWDRQMHALGTPPRGQSAWAALLKQLQAHARIIADQQKAALRRDGAAFTRDDYAGNKAQTQIVAAAKAAGVPVCATAAGA